jgi:hypothetical protein
MSWMKYVREGIEDRGRTAEAISTELRGTLSVHTTQQSKLGEAKKYEDAVRPVIDRAGKYRYTIRDGNRGITIADLRRAAFGM